MRFNDGSYFSEPIADYTNAMDPGNYAPPEAEDEVRLGINEIGMSVPMGISAQNAAGIASKIRMGAGNIEIGFPGAFSGNRQAQTPGMYGKDQRRAIRELGMANDVKFTTHAAYNLMGLSGQDQQGNFNLDHARLSQREVNRAIDFAADTAGGGSVVVHTGEFNRPLSYMNQTGMDYSRDHDGFLMFRKSVAEPYNAQFELVDKRTGQVMKTVQLDRLVARPVWLQHKGEPIKGRYQLNSDNQHKDLCGTETTIHPGDYVDYEGNKIINPFDATYGRVPELDMETGRFKSELKPFKHFIHEAEEKNEWFEKVNKRKPEFHETTTPVEAFLHATLEVQEGHSRGWALQYGLRAGEQIKALHALRKARDFYQRLDDEMAEDDKWKMTRQFMAENRYAGEAQSLLPVKTAQPLQIIDHAINEVEKEIEFARQASASQELQAVDTFETKNNIVEPIKYIKERTIRNYAESAIHAMRRSNDPNNPITLTMENIFPERFGGHPQELRWLIKESRNQFVEMLTKEKIPFGGAYADETQYEINQKEGIKPVPTANPYYNPNVSVEEAEKLAEQHIKATLDTGHAYMWKKYWDPKPGLSPEENEKAFHKWWLGEIEKLAAEKMIGNIHLTDNFGYQDDHLAPGQGSAPLKEVIKILKKHGYDKAITVEPGADASTDISDFHGLMKTWRHFGSPIYGSRGGALGLDFGMRSGAPQTWTDVHYSYFGVTTAPYFVFGQYAPSNDWTLWSSVPIE